MDRSSAATFAFFIILYIALCILSIVIIYTIMVRCYQISQDYTTNLSARPGIPLELTQGLGASIIDSFPKFAYLSGDMDTDIDTNRIMAEECVICLGVFEANEMLRILPKCGHVFHVGCIDTWLRSRATCPFCRVNLLDDDGPPQEMPARADVPIEVDRQWMGMVQTVAAPF